jgi:hypothetical protein
MKFQNMERQRVKFPKLPQIQKKGLKRKSRDVKYEKSLAALC